MKTVEKKLSFSNRVINATIDIADGDVRIGVIMTPKGYVKVYTQDGFTSLSFLHKGKRKGRYIYGGRKYTSRGLSTIAHRFIKEVK